LGVGAGATAGERDASLLSPGASAWQLAGHGAIRGVTIGPIESALHPGKGYGSTAYEQTLGEAERLGANWVSLTPFARVWDLHGTGISLSFEAPFGETRQAIVRAIRQAHARGLRVLIVPHLWVESGDWRGELDPGTDAAWADWSRNYRAFLLTWAEVARDAHADMLSCGVELRSWLTTAHASSFSPILHDVRQLYPGLLTYAGNWDDIEQTVILGDLDVIGLNAFFPLAEKDGASAAELAAGGQRVRDELKELASAWQKPIFFNEFGYTTRANPAIRPWEWPDKMSHVVPDQAAQADAYRALLSAFVDEPWFAGFFMWRLYADPNDMSQEAEWGFSPRGKQAELVLRNAFHAHWAADGEPELGGALWRDAATDIGRF
jgi:glycosyl hydrolase family 113